MHDWLRPLHDAEGMRAVDSWAIAERGVPSLALMEAAGAAVADAVRDLARDRPDPRGLRQGEQRRRRPGGGASARRRRASRSSRCCCGPRRSSRPTRANLERLDRAGAGRSAPARSRPRSRARARSSTRSSARASAGAPRSPALGGHRGDQRVRALRSVAADIASGVDATTGEVEGVGGGGRPSPSPSTPPSSGHRIAPGKRHAGELRVADIGIPEASPVAAGGRRDRPGGAARCRRGAARIRPSSRRARCSSPAARAG